MLMERPINLKTPDTIIMYNNPWKEWIWRTDIHTNQVTMVFVSTLLFFVSIRQKYMEEIAKDPAVIDVVAYALQFLAFFMIGVVSWTVLEYKTHRFELHDHDAITDYMGEDKIELHHLHHMFPNQDKIIVIPLWKSLGIASVV